MPVVKYSELKLADVNTEGAAKTLKANVIGPAQGWQDHTLRLFRVDPGGFTPRHQHDWEHIIGVISGEVRLTIGGEVFELAERDFAIVPPNIVHQFENPHPDPVEFICIVPNRGA